MITLVIFLILLILLLIVIGRLLIHWTNIQEGVIVYRCTPDMKICSKYQVIMIGDQKYLADMNYREPHMRYGFHDYIKDVQRFRVFTEDQVDSFD